jgi:3-hydroxy-9,10-secoandrosta-1,3,5(10)-triene-9,17-dione monooxygenase
MRCSTIRQTQEPKRWCASPPRGCRRCASAGPGCEALRRIPEETVAEFIGYGFHRIAQPVRFGGMGLGLDVPMEVAMEVGRGCGSMAWMASQRPGHNLVVGMFPMAAQEEYWAESHDVLCSTASAIVACKCESAVGGIQFSGRWKFSSGIDGSHWAIVSVADQFCLVPCADYRIVDDWHVSGLRGSGSKSIVVDNAFVPEHRMFSAQSFFEGRTLGREYYDNPFYRLPYLMWAPGLIGASVLGATQGVVDVFEDRVLKRVDMMGVPAKESGGNQLRFAEASAEVDAARLILRRQFQEMIERGKADDAVLPLELARAAWYDLCREAVSASRGAPVCVGRFERHLRVQRH